VGSVQLAASICSPLPTVHCELPSNIDGPLFVLPVSLANPEASGYEAPALFGKFYGQAERAISNGLLNVSPRLHIRPIKLVVFQRPS
jgi:hypothetical protein